MTTLDAAAVAQLALRVGVVTEGQLQEVWEEIGPKTTDPHRLLLALERKSYITPWQSNKMLKGENDGYFLGGYRVLYKIASGSFGRVFRAEDPTTGRVVAIKVLRRRWSVDQQRIEWFSREAKVGMSLQHPNIVEILAVGHDLPTGQYFMVMEFVEGGNLREILGIRKKLAPADALKLMEDAVTGLAHAYQRGITHRDVKLTNILVSAQGTAKLVDFGLAQIYAGATREADMVERTVDYAGLEKATGVKSGDVRSDIFFLGCVLYEMLTGRSPLEMTRDKHARMNPRRFSEVQPMRKDEVDAPPAAFQLVETMMSLTPQRRYQTPSQLLDAVRAVRREVDLGKGTKGTKGGASGPSSVFVVESDDRLQEAIRNKFKEMGFRVYLAIDPMRALERFQQQPYNALIIDAGTVGEDGVLAFDRIMAEAERHGQSLAGVLILNEEQSAWTVRVKARPGGAVLVRPVTLKQLHRKLRELLGGEDEGEGTPGEG
jgi:eukaryotic-like serine/threonine-protein kinase